MQTQQPCTSMYSYCTVEKRDARHCVPPLIALLLPLPPPLLDVHFLSRRGPEEVVDAAEDGGVVFGEKAVVLVVKDGLEKRGWGGRKDRRGREGERDRERERERERERDRERKRKRKRGRVRNRETEGHRERQEDRRNAPLPPQGSKQRDRKETRAPCGPSRPGTAGPCTTPTAP